MDRASLLQQLRDTEAETARTRERFDGLSKLRNALESMLLLSDISAGEMSPAAAATSATEDIITGAKIAAINQGASESEAHEQAVEIAQNAVNVAAPEIADEVRSSLAEIE